MSWGVQSDHLPPTELGVGKGILLQYQTEQKFEQYVIHKLSASQTLEHFLPELNVLAFCM
jgi:hypothetical protein